VKIESNQSDPSSVDDVTFSVSFDNGTTFPDEYKNLSATQAVSIKETGLTIEFSPNALGSTLYAGYQYKIAVQAARTPATLEERYKALTEAYK